MGKIHYETYIEDENSVYIGEGSYAMGSTIELMIVAVELLCEVEKSIPNGEERQAFRGDFLHQLNQRRKDYNL